VSTSAVEERPEDMTEEQWATHREAVRAKYAAERDKRLRADGPTQYLNLVGEYAHYRDDPYREEIVEREPVTDDADVVILGGGFGGLLSGARLRQLGVRDIRLIDKAGDVGGTWYWNRYPGAQCDVESYVYLPLLEEVGYIPKEKYSHAPEILEHSRNIARTFDLYDGALFQTNVTELRWDDDASRWIISTDRGDTLRARFVVWACGPLDRAKLPGIPGINDFEGKSFHSSRWDYTYTGGNSEGNLTGLRDKRVAIIGTGASAVQIVPHVGEWAEQLYVFQRTPSGVDRRDNRPTDPEWAAGLEPGWQKRRIENFTNLVSGVPEPEDLVMDAWTDLIGNMLRLMSQTEVDGLTPDKIADVLELADYQKMESIRGRVQAIVDDPNTAEALKPYYRQFCKRPCFHDEYLPTFNRPNVTLVDTDGKGVERITRRGIVANGVEYEVDCIIYATGFEVATSLTQKAGLEAYGRDGAVLTERCQPPRTLHGVHMRDFPNLFFIAYFGTSPTVNFPHGIDILASHIAWLADAGLREGIEVFEADPDAVQGWIDLGKTFVGRVRDPNCTPGYYNNEGQPKDNNPWNGGVLKFGEILQQWRDAGTFEGLDITYGTPSSS
jgi:cation diffusion facilitator CzcD-associated flavoprotein CzcO